MRPCQDPVDRRPPPTPVVSVEPLLPFDHLMLADARPGHPMCFLLECIVEGDLEEHRLRRAVHEASQRHPRLRSRVAWRGRRPFWLTPDVEPAFIWRPEVDSGDPWRPVDIGRESGMRVVARLLGPRRHGILLVVHHAVCDGIAACEFMGDIWACYAGIDPPVLSETSSEVRAASEPKRRPATIDMVRELLTFARFFPMPLKRVPSGGRQAAVEPPYATIELDASFTSRLRAAAATRNATVNDLIVAAVMRACLSWNERAGAWQGGVRVTMPVSTRSPGRRIPASNAISYAFLDRAREACRDRESLVRSIASASRWILASGVIGGFLEAVGVLARHPLLLGAVTRLPVCLSTVIVSNVGDVGRRMRSGLPRRDGRDVPGGLVIRGFRGVPPLRPRTRAAVGVLTYAGSTTLSCLCSAASDPRAAAHELLEMIRVDLDAWTSDGPAHAVDGPPVADSRTNPDTL